MGEPGLDIEEPVRLSGKFALYEYTVGPFSGGDIFAGIQVADLRTGRKRATVDFDDTATFPTTVRAVAIKRNGTFAWVQDRREGGLGGDPRRTLQMCRLATCGRGADEAARPVLVAEGFDIKARSIALRGSRVYWTQAGRRRSAPLAGPPVAATDRTEGGARRSTRL